MSKHFRAKGIILGAFLLVFPLMSFAQNETWFDSAREGDLQNLAGQLKAKPELINAQDEKGYTAFVLATYNNQNAYAEQLLKLGADACLTDKKGNSALMGVIFKGHQEIAMSLINKCDVNHRNREGQTALMYASLFGREKIATELMKQGAKKELKDHQGRDAITLAEGQWNQAMVGLLKTFRIIN